MKTLSFVYGNRVSLLYSRKEYHLVPRKVNPLNSVFHCQVRTPLMNTWRGWCPRPRGPLTSPCSSPCLEKGSTEQTPRTSSATPLPVSTRRDLVSQCKKIMTLKLSVCGTLSNTWSASKAWSTRTIWESCWPPWVIASQTRRWTSCSARRP